MMWCCFLAVYIPFPRRHDFIVFITKFMNILLRHNSIRVPSLYIRDDPLGAEGSS